MISKVFCNISVSFRLFQSLEISDLAMTKDEKVNIAVAYIQVKPLLPFVQGMLTEGEGSVQLASTLR
jgi:hypothetical protein